MNASLNSVFEKAVKLSILALPVTIHLRFAWASINLIVLSVLFLLSFFINRESLKTEVSKWYWLPVLFFGIYFLRALFLDDLSESVQFAVQKKLPLLVVPIVFYRFRNLISRELTQSFLKVFAASVLVLSLIALGKGALLFFESGVFPFYHDLSNLVRFHAIYMSVSVAISWMIIRENQHWFSAIKWFNMLLQAFFGVLLLLLSSKTILVVIAVMFSLIEFNKLRQKSNWKMAVSLSLAIVLGSFALYQFSPIGKRFKMEVNSNKEVVFQENYTYDTPFTGFTLRAVIWKLSLETLSENKAFLFGLGPRKSQELLNEKYRDKGMYSGNPNFGDKGYQGYNAHNEYMQTLLDTGVFGLLLLVFWLVLLFKSAKNKALLFQIVILFTVFGLSESFLESQRGIMPFVLFTVLFILGEATANRKTIAT